MGTEIDFKFIPGYENCYLINEKGDIKGIHFHGKERILKSHLSRRGYLRVKLQKDGEKLSTGIHRLVALTFIPNPENKPEVNHKDGNKLNNHVFNLEWVTTKENVCHAWKTGLITQERVSAVWTKEKREQAKGRWARGKNGFAKKVKDLSTGQIFDCVGDAADKFGYSYNQLKQWLNGRRPNKSTLTYL